MASTMRVGIYDPDDMWKFVADGFQTRLPLMHVQTAFALTNFVSLHTHTIDPLADMACFSPVYKHRLHMVPAFSIYVMRCLDLDGYKLQHKNKLRLFSGALLREDEEKKEASNPFLVLYVPLGTRSASDKSSKKVFSQLKSDFGKQRCFRLDLFDPAMKGANVETQWKSLFEEAHSLVSAAFARRWAVYDQEIKAAADNLGVLYSVKESQVMCLMQMQLKIPAMSLFHELEAIDVEAQSTHSGRTNLGALFDYMDSLQVPQRIEQLTIEPSLFRKHRFAQHCRLLLLLHKPSEMASRAVQFLQSFEVESSGLSAERAQRWRILFAMDVYRILVESLEHLPQQQRITYHTLGVLFHLVLRQVRAFLDNTSHLLQEEEFVGLERQNDSWSRTWKEHETRLDETPLSYPVLADLFRLCRSCYRYAESWRCLRAVEALEAHLTLAYTRDHSAALALLQGHIDSLKKQPTWAHLAEESTRQVGECLLALQRPVEFVQNNICLLPDGLALWEAQARTALKDAVCITNARDIATFIPVEGIEARVESSQLLVLLSHPPPCVLDRICVQLRQQQRQQQQPDAVCCFVASNVTGTRILLDVDERIEEKAQVSRRFSSAMHSTAAAAAAAVTTTTATTTTTTTTTAAEDKEKEGGIVAMAMPSLPVKWTLDEISVGIGPHLTIRADRRSLLVTGLKRQHVISLEAFRSTTISRYHPGISLTISHPEWLVFGQFQLVTLNVYTNYDSLRAQSTLRVEEVEIKEGAAVEVTVTVDGKEREEQTSVVDGAIAVPCDVPPNAHIAFTVPIRREKKADEQSQQQPVAFLATVAYSRCRQALTKDTTEDILLYHKQVDLFFQEPLVLESSVDRLGSRWFLQISLACASPFSVLLLGYTLELPEAFALVHDPNKACLERRCVQPHEECHLVFEIRPLMSEKKLRNAAWLELEIATLTPAVLPGIDLDCLVSFPAQDELKSAEALPSTQAFSLPLMTREEDFHITVSFPPHGYEGQLIPFRVNVARMERKTGGGDEEEEEGECLLVHLVLEEPLWMVSGRQSVELRIAPGKEASFECALLPLVCGYLSVPSVQLLCNQTVAIHSSRILHHMASQQVCIFPADGLRTFSLTRIAVDF